MSASRFAVCVIGVACLSGCGGLFGSKQSRVSEVSDVDVAAVYHDYAVEQLENGRQLISRGAYANALQPLRKASADPETAPAAYNAIGVAYVKLGREDVATRFFSLALVLDPENPTIVANFRKFKDQLAGKSQNNEKMAAAERIEAEIAMAGNEDQQSGVRVEETSRIVKPAYGSRLSVSASGSALSRVSPREVRVGGSNTMQSSAKRPAVAAQYPARLEFKRQLSSPARPEYPVKFNLLPASE